jgi:hypothetical protein
LGGAINGISYGQMPIDAAKGFAVPGTELKELFRPLFNISTQIQLAQSVAIVGQKFWQWEPYRLPEAGSFLSNADLLDKGGESLLLAPGVFLPHGNDNQPDGHENWGVGLIFSPDWMTGGRIGVFYRRFADMLPQVHLDLARNNYFSVYPDQIELYGLSVSKKVGPISIGFEYSYRHNMPLQSQSAVILPGMSPPPQGDTLMARGDTHHALINFMQLLPGTAFYGGASWNAEFTYARWQRVTENENTFKGRDDYNAIDHVTKDALGVAINFVPTWYQVLAGVDLSMPISYSRGLMGNSALVFGDQEAGGSASIGLSADIFNKYTASLNYVMFYGKYDVDANGAFSAGTGNASLSDRDMLTFTFKFTF